MNSLDLRKKDHTMNQTHMLYPLFALVSLTFFIVIRLGLVRVRAVRQDGLNPGYFKYNRGGKPPEYMLRTEQNYTNLFELPILFYVAVIIAYITASVDLANILLAWLFVITRFIHTYSHLLHNKLLLRRKIFLYSSLVLIILWVKLFIQFIT